MKTLEEAHAGKLRVFVYGWVEYDDIVGGPRHRTELCNEIVAIETPDNPTQVVLSFQEFDTYNSAT